MAIIKTVKARTILDSRGNPTVECDIKTNEGLFRASVPSGASTGIHEALELRDHKKKFLGQGVQKAVDNINKKIARKIIGLKATQEIDEILIKLDGTKDKSKLGANAMLAVSMAIARANAGKKPLYEYFSKLTGQKARIPIPSFNIINGGKHAGNKLDIQEYMIMPTRAKKFSEALRMASEIYHTLKKDLEHNYGKMAINVGDEGGFAPPLTCAKEPLDYIANTIIKLGYWKEVKLAIDCAATTYWKGNRYYFEGHDYTQKKLTEFYEEIAEEYPLISIEDPYQEEAFDDYAKLHSILKNTQIVGDDLTVTNPERIRKAILHNSCNCLLLKINQIGTITEALQAAKIARQAGWKIMTSHRSGETTDDFIADLAVGIGAEQIKSGAPCRGERLAKYNQLIRIEEKGVKYGRLS